MQGVVWDASAAPAADPQERVDTVVARHRLHRLVDFRQAIRDWFAHVAVGGHLVISVPHAFLRERALALPSPWEAEQRRLYTPASLAQEVEEALEPNSYRIRFLGDLDQDYDYALPPTSQPVGESDVGIVLQRIAQPSWSLTEAAAVPAIAPPFQFEPLRSRVETNHFPDIARILVLKLDHLGDFIMGLPALERLRAAFPQAHLTLVVGTWNAAMAAELQVADRIIEFNAFPRNSTEEEANVEATLGLFRSLVTDDYDLAIDLRSDIDTRLLLRAVKSPLKAGIGTRARFPFLDIALPLDATRNEAERAKEDRVGFHAFSAQDGTERRHFGIRSRAAEIERHCAIIWGPYLGLAPGDYIFDFYIDLEDDRDGGMLKLDVALDGKVMSEMIVSSPQNFHLHFHVDKPGAKFEARVWAVDDRPSIDFTFYGGVLIKRGSRSVLHQSEYLSLLIELVAMRIKASGVLGDTARA